MVRPRIVSMKIIGWVKNDILEETSKAQWPESVSEIIIEPEFSQDLIGIELYRYVAVLFWMDRANPDRSVGSLATCFPTRPNPIGITFVKLLERNGNILTVKGLDAFNGTPVLDIKPYKPWSFKRMKERLPDINIERLEGGI